MGVFKNVFGTDAVIYENLGREKSLAFLVLHSFNGCDNTSDFGGRGKKSVWAALNCYQDVTRASTYISLHPYTQLMCNITI